jgi:hypothetical protein
MDEFGKRTDPPMAVAIIGDIVSSRHLADRGEVQRRLVARLTRLNGAAGSGVIAADLRITAGDEIQCLLWQPAYSLEIVQQVADELHPVAMAFGVGRGPLSTGDSFAPPQIAPDVAQLDGECFHLARAALERAQSRNAWVVVSGFGSLMDESLAALFELMGVVRSGWTRKQAHYTARARNQAQKDVAAESGVSPSVVSESLKAAKFEPMLRAEAAAKRILGSFGPEAKE